MYNKYADSAVDGAGGGSTMGSRGRIRIVAADNGQWIVTADQSERRSPH